MEEFTIEKALYYQSQHLNDYYYILKPEVFNDLKRWVNAWNDHGYSSPYEVKRGSDLDSFVHNYLLQLRAEKTDENWYPSFPPKK